jgi:hypothetical protein
MPIWPDLKRRQILKIEKNTCKNYTVSTLVFRNRIVLIEALYSSNR